jgi:hypothetical protein
MWNTNDTSNYSSNMQKVGTFSTMWDFLQHWENLPHSTPNFYFSNFKEGLERRIEGVPSPIEAVGVFEEGILPAWEDPVNAKGSDFNFRKQMDESTLRKNWKKLVFSLIGETFPASEDVVGVRIVDKGRHIKCEIWVKYDSDAFPDKTNAVRKWMTETFNLANGDVQMSPHGNKSKKN